MLSRSRKLSLVHDQVLVADWPPRKKHGNGDEEEKTMITMRLMMGRMMVMM